MYTLHVHVSVLYMYISHTPLPTLPPSLPPSYSLSPPPLAREDQPAEAKAQLAFLVQAVSKLLSRGGRGKEFDALLAYQVLCKVRSMRVNAATR